MDMDMDTRGKQVEKAGLDSMSWTRKNETVVEH